MLLCHISFFFFIKPFIRIGTHILIDHVHDNFVDRILSHIMSGLDYPKPNEITSNDQAGRIGHSARFPAEKGVCT
jgi:hypothetical protein